MAAIAGQLAEARPEGLLLVAQSNAGLPQVVGDHFEYDATPADMAEHARALHDARHRPDRRLLRLDAGAHRGDARRRRLSGIPRGTTAWGLSVARRHGMPCCDGTAARALPAAEKKNQIPGRATDTSGTRGTGGGGKILHHLRGVPMHAADAVGGRRAHHLGPEQVHLGRLAGAGGPGRGHHHHSGSTSPAASAGASASEADVG